MKRFLKILLKISAFAFLALITLVVVIRQSSADVPAPIEGSQAEADAAAHAMMEAVDYEAWQRTGAVQWTFRGSREHLWDRERGLARVRWKKNEVFVDLATREGRAFQGGKEVEGAKAADLVDQGWKAWINDSFWLNPVVKIFDEGTERSFTELKKEGRGLRVEYTQGGATPGDVYVWVLGEDSLPTMWRMWTSNLPMGGVKATWEDWIALDTGAKIAAGHKAAIGRIDMTDVAGAATLAELVPGEDPFAVLFE